MAGVIQYVRKGPCAISSILGICYSLISIFVTSELRLFVGLIQTQDVQVVELLRSFIVVPCLMIELCFWIMTHPSFRCQFLS